MSRQAKGPRLWLRRARTDARGRITHKAVWIIKDGRTRLSTGFGPDDRRQAEIRLGQHLQSKHAPSRERRGNPDQIPIADVISIYLQDKAAGQARPKELAQRAGTLLAFFADPDAVRSQLKKMEKPARYGGYLSDIRGDVCRAYAQWRAGTPWKSARPADTGNEARRVSTAAPRRELEDLRSAINYHRREGYCREVIEVTLPEKAQARTRWLTRDEAAALIRAAWRMTDERNNRRVGRHIARFIMVALYTGTRSTAVCQAAIGPTVGHGYVDLDRGIFYRKAEGKRETKKRQPPVKLPTRLIAHMQRWVDKGISQRFIVEWNGKPVNSVRGGFARAVHTAGLGNDVVPHTLRHTAATWLMQAGVDIWKAAGYVGMTPEMLTERYGHHHPDYQIDAAEAITSAHRPRPDADKNTRVR